MKEFLIMSFFLAYTISELISYIPQIVKMIKTKKADDLSLGSWTIWLVGSCTYLGYVCLATPNIGLIMMSLLDIASCLTVFSLTVYYQAKRLNYPTINNPWGIDKIIL